MADWKVAKEEIKLFEHPGADRLEVARVGTYALVVQKGLYQDGDTIIMAPKGSLLPSEIAEPFRDYLSGSNKDRVREVRLRGELSQGIVLPLDVVREFVPEIDDVPVGEDISERLGISEYIPPIPIEMQGQLEPIRDLPWVTNFDVEQFRIFSDEIQEGEEVIITEKVHGSSLPVFYHKGEITVSSKGNLKRGFKLIESETNAYWRAVRNSGLDKLLAEIAMGYEFDDTINVVGEMIPCAKGYDYGQTEPTIRIFEFKVNAEPQPIPTSLEHLRVPVLYEGPFSEAKAVELSKGMEQVSGKQRHIREGVVVRPKIPRRTSVGSWMHLKVINPSYAKKTTGEEIN